jgi:hypothetical protein
MNVAKNLAGDVCIARMQGLTKPAYRNILLDVMAACLMFYKIVLHHVF